MTFSNIKCYSLSTVSLRMATMISRKVVGQVTMYMLTKRYAINWK